MILLTINKCQKAQINRSHTHTHTHTHNRRISRRGFLKFAGVLTGTALLTSYGINVTNEKVVGILWENFPEIISDESKIDVFLKTSVPLLSKKAKDRSGEFVSEFEPNTNFKPMSKLIQNGIEIYGRPVYFNPAEKQITSEQFINTLEAEKNKTSEQAQSITVEDILAYLKEDGSYDQKKLDRVFNFMSNTELNVLSNPTMTAVTLATNNYNRATHIIVQDWASGFAKRAMNGEKIETNHYQVPNPPWKSMHDELADRYENKSYRILADLNESFQFLKSKFESSGKRISTSELLAYFLEKNQGELSDSIYDVAVFLKVLARNDFNYTSYDLNYIANNPEYQKMICDRFSMIEDEFGLHGQDFGLPISQKTGQFDNNNKDLSLINRVGLAYHNWSIVALNLIVDRIPVKVSTIETQLFVLKKAQGYTKSASDFNRLLELEAIDELLATYQI